MGERWEEVLDHQLSLHEWWRTTLGSAWAKGWGGSVVESYAPELRRAMRGMYEDLPRRCAMAAILADPIYVEPDMMTLLEAALQTFDPEPLLPSDPPTEAGFVWLPRPFMAVDRHGLKVSWRVINWYPAEHVMIDREKGVTAVLPGVFVAFYNLVTDPDDYPWPDPKRLPPQPLVLDHIAALPWGEDPVDSYESNHPEMIAPEARSSYTNVYRLIQCLWRLMAQQIAVGEPRTASGPFRKRWERARKTSPKPVTIVRLRRVASRNESPDREPTQVNWSHRWLVNGHWRKVWHATLGPAYLPDGQMNPKSHRQQWIAPFIKGPEDKPLVAKVRALEWVR